MTPAQITGTTFRGGLFRGVLAGAVALLVVYGVLFLTSDEQTATAQAPCEQGTAVSSPADNPGLVSDCAILLAVKDTLRGSDRLNWSADRAITSWEGITVSGTPGRVTRLVLDRNTSPQLYGRRITLTGTIPAALGGLSKLQRLTLARHELTGTIPVELANLSELTDLRLFGNQLTGGIPPQLGNLSNLTRLDLGTNPLGGAIPVELGKLSNLRSLRLANSQLTGSIPASLGALSNLTQLDLYGNTGLTGCVPASLRGIRGIGLGSLGLEYCTTTTTYSLTVTAGGNGRVSPLPGTYSYLSGASVTVTATPDDGYRVASWGGDCSASGTAKTCALTLDANKTASVTFERITHTLTVTVEGEGGSVTPPGTTTHGEGEQVTVTATPEAGYRVDSWGGDCTASGTNLACVLTMDGDKAASVTFEEGTAYTLTISAGANGSVSPAPGTYRYDEDEQVTVTATPDAGYRVTSWGGDCSGSGTNVTCVLTMDGDKTASVTFEPGTAYTLTTTAGEGGSVTPGGMTTHNQGDEVTLTASWNDATHSFTGWGGDCDGTATTCALTMDGAKTVTATFAALAADRCAEPTDADCIRAVYLGAPGDYAQVVDIPADVLLTPAADGRYYVERGRQYTVVTAAPLPAGWTRFYLERTPLGDPHAVSHEQLIPPVGTTYTFTVTEDEAAATLITFDLKEARPFVRPRPDGKPDIGDTVVTTVFSVVNCESGVAVPNPTANTELVEDCESLLKARDRLAGTATLNWSAGRAMTTWTGVTVAGTPQRVTKLELASSGLNGELTGLLGNLTGLTHLRLNGNTLTGRSPSKLQLLTALTHLYLANDALTGCLPVSLRDVTNNDLAALNLPDCGLLRRVSDERAPLLEGGQTVSYQIRERGPGPRGGPSRGPHL